jgi:GT2 family glycosyltransferase
MTEPIGLSVIIPTLNRSQYLCQTIVGVLDQKYSPLEILVVDQSAQIDEHAVGLAKASGGIVSYHHVNFCGLPMARNYGWTHARYDAILFLDDDIQCYPRLLEEHVRCLRLAGVGIVAGAVEDVRHRGASRSREKTGYFHPITAVAAWNFWAEGEFEVDHAPGGNFSAWRAVFEKCRGIDEVFTVGAALNEETDFCLRARRNGYRVLFNGAARIVHLAAPGGGCRELDRHKYMWGLAHNQAIMILRHVAWFYRPRGLARLLMTAASLSVQERDWRLFTACLSGAIKGIAAARMAGHPSGG